MRLRRKINISYYAALFALLISLASAFLGGGSDDRSRPEEALPPKAIVSGASENHVGLGPDERKSMLVEDLRKEIDRLGKRIEDQGKSLLQLEKIQAVQDDQKYKDFTFAGPERIEVWHSSATQHMNNILKELPSIKKNITENVRDRINVLDEYESRIELRDQDFNILVTKIVTEELQRGIDTPISMALVACKNEAELSRKMLMLTGVTRLEQGCATLFEPFFSMTDLGSVGDISLFESTSLKIVNDAVEFVPVVGDALSITSIFFNARLEYSVFGKTDNFIAEVLDNVSEEILQRLDGFLTARQYYEMLRIDFMENALEKRPSQAGEQVKTSATMER